LTEPNSSLDQARRKVAQIAAEIQKLAKSELDPPVFFDRFLQLLLGAVGARAGAIWMIGPNRQAAQIAQSRMVDTQILQDPGASEDNAKLIQDVLSTGQARNVAPEHRSVARFPIPCLALLAPLHKGEDCVGVVELFLKPDTPEQARPGYLQFVEQMAGHASRFVSEVRTTTASGSGDGFWKELSEFNLELLGSLKPKHVAAVAVNDGRLLLKCDRVSVVMRKGRKLTVESVSGQDTVHHRSNLIRSMVKLSKRVLPSKKTFTFGELANEPPPTLKEPLAEFLAESGARRLVVVPLFEPDPIVQKKHKHEADKDKLREKKQAFGCLVVEQLSQNEGSDDLAERAELVADHAAAALANSRRHHRVFLRPLFSAIGGARDWLHGRRLIKTLLILGLLGGFVASMIWIKRDYRVEAEGRLMPANRQAVFAPWEGEVVEIFVDDGKRRRVKKGQRLLRLQNLQLETDLGNARSELAAKQQEQIALQAQIDSANRNAEPSDTIRLRGQLMETQERIRGWQSQIKVLTERHDALTVRAPISGVVTTFRVRELLNQRPAQRGEVLMEIADDEGKWRLELDVEELRMGHLLGAQRDQGRDLDVQFVLATDPVEDYWGELQTIATRPKRLPEKGSLVEVFASIPDNHPELQRRIGAEVRAKIYCGKASLGYVLIGDAIDFVRRKWWW
jgi:biotin carboxyl carrier protein